MFVIIRDDKEMELVYGALKFDTSEVCLADVQNKIKEHKAQNSELYVCEIMELLEKELPVKWYPHIPTIWI